VDSFSEYAHVHQLAESVSGGEHIPGVAWSGRVVRIETCSRSFGLPLTAETLLSVTANKLAWVAFRDISAQLPEGPDPLDLADSLQRCARPDDRTWSSPYRPRRANAVLNRAASGVPTPATVEFIERHRHTTVRRRGPAWVKNTLRTHILRGRGLNPRAAVTLRVSDIEARSRPSDSSFEVIDYLIEFWTGVESALKSDVASDLLLGSTDGI